MDEDRLSRSDLEGYQDVMLMLSAIVDESQQTPPSPGAYSAICYDADVSHLAGKSITEHAHVARRQRLGLTIGCKRHLEYQMREIWSEFVDTAVQNGQNDASLCHPRSKQPAKTAILRVFTTKWACWENRARE